MYRSFAGDVSISIMKPRARIDGVRNARLRGRREAADIRIDSDGLITAIGTKLKFKPGEKTVDAAGGLTLPGFVDPHVHLDLAYSLDLVKPNKSGTLIEAIRHWSAAKKTMSAASVLERAVRAIDAEAGFGTTHIRTHVDVGSTAGLRLVEGVLAAARVPQPKAQRMRGDADAPAQGHPDEPEIVGREPEIDAGADGDGDRVDG